MQHSVIDRFGRFHGGSLGDLRWLSLSLARQSGTSPRRGARYDRLVPRPRSSPKSAPSALLRLARSAPSRCARASLAILPLLACGSRTPLDEGEPEPMDPPSTCAINDRVAADGRWLRRVGAADASQIGVSEAGNITLVARVRGAIRLDCVDLPALGEEDLLLASFTEEGDVRWAKRLGGAAIDSFQSGVDADGNLYLVASSPHGQLDLGGGPLPAGIVLASFDENGTHRWSVGYEQTAATSLQIRSGTVGSLGDTSAAIAFQGSLEIEGERYEGGLDQQRAQLVLRWDAGGTIVLRRYLPPDAGVTLAAMASGPEGAWALSARTEDGVFVDVLDGELLRWSFEIGSVPAALLFTPTQLIAGGDHQSNLYRPFIEALDVDTGEPRWVSFLLSWRGENESQWPPYATSIVAVDGALVAAAPLLGTVGFADGSEARADGFDALLMRYDDTGMFQTVDVIGGPANQRIDDMEVTPEARLALTMEAPDGLDLGFGSPATACDGACDQLYVALIDAPR